MVEKGRYRDWENGIPSIDFNPSKLSWLKKCVIEMGKWHPLL